MTPTDHEPTTPGGERLPPGTRALDHTADVGVEIEAPDLPQLFLRAGHALEALIAGSPQPPSTRDGREPSTAAEREQPLTLEAPDVALLLADWLRELLFLRQVRGRAFVDAGFERLTETGLATRVRTTPAPGAVREIKGVTYHGLVAHRDGAGWRARVIFDV